MNDIALLLIAAYLRKIITPGETDAETAAGISLDLAAFRTYLDGLDKTNIDKI